MFLAVRVARKKGKVACHNCGSRVMPGTVYLKISGLNYCVLCDGPGREAWEKLK